MTRFTGKSLQAILTMASNLNLLPVLKERLLSATNFSEVAHYFLDHFAENPEFLSLGKAMRNKLITTMAQVAAREITGLRKQSLDLLLTHLPEHRFYHGGGHFGAAMAVVFYFADIRTGLLALEDLSDPGCMFYGRLSASDHPGGAPSGLN